ncbi:carbohydrate ABC transporter permease [Hungatella effluvii]|uniref:carbohydrate ABC transporter permease n=1 Tax=Hungatella effluvii TaxID=1096246 RepID=UPI0022E3369F|nr:carbohydrate ABC transporter permease [Hungatella effluvii]
MNRRKRAEQTPKRSAGLIILEVILILCAAVYIYPVFLMFTNSFKSFKEVLVNVVALPTHLEFANYTHVIEKINYGRLFFNNVAITFTGIMGIVFFSSLAAYILARRNTRFTRAAYMFCIIPMLVPFQTIMITLVKVMKTLHLSGSLLGLGIQYWGFGIPMAVFIYMGFIKTIPRAIDESATIDGASAFSTYVRIIFPLLKPVTATVMVLDVMWIWNDFLLPMLMVNSSPKTKTLTLAAYTFVGQYNTQWQYAMTAMVLALLPSILFFIFMQKHIIKGVVAGAVKG